MKTAARQPRPRVAEKLAATLRAAIVKGRYAPGAALPSERELAERYEVNRSSVREALRRLEAWGLVTIRHGGATRVTEALLDAGFGVLPDLLASGGQLADGVLADLHELRALFLGWSAEQAALKADAASMARLEALARQLAEPRQKPATLQALDYDFFEQLVLITGNQLLAVLARLVRDFYFRAPDTFLPMYRPGVFDPAHHQRCVAAIRARAPNEARDAMRAHALSALATKKGATA